MIKKYLISYTPEVFQALNGDSTTYTLLVRKVYFWGLFIDHKKIEVDIPWRVSFIKRTDRWDEMIKSGMDISGLDI